ncbi:MAG: hypothetical protein K5636_06465 [Bacteroidales bacterium]|nr:hypothetical protein [Bacteroidales bacterium]
MRRFFVLWCCFCLLLCGCQTRKAEQAELIRHLSSHFGCVTNEWQFQYNGEWYPATVPGSIHTDLMANKLIPDPFFSTNEDSVQWVADSVWTYKLIFDGNCSNERNYKHQELVFEGLDTYAEVYLNGILLHNDADTFLAFNMFRKWKYPLAEPLKEKGNELVVKFYPTALRDSIAAAKLPYAMPDTRVFTRKAQYESGWDWGPKLNTCGIWKDVYIHGWDDFELSDVYVRDSKPTYDSTATWTTDVEVRVTAKHKGRAKVTVQLADPEGASLDNTTQRVRLQPGENIVTIPISIKKPRLWWPNGMGDQPLYQYTVTVESNGRATASNPILHGLRTIELKREKDSIGESFAFLVNGKPCFMRGADWIPASSYVGTLNTPEGSDVYYRLLHDAKEVNMNMLRVWGGGIYENEAFYRYCDQLGLLVWQDFMFACNPYPGDESFMANVTQEVTEQVMRLRNHPCIAVWCGNNEVHNGLEDWGWQTALGWTDDQYQGLMDDFHQLFEQKLAKIVAEKHPNAPYVSTSPTYGWGHAECTTHGCSHYWGVWWGELPFEVWWDKTGRFMSEYGFQSYPEWSTLKTFTRENERKYYSSALKSHQKHARGTQIIGKAMLAYFDYDKIDFLNEYAYVSQLVQAYGIEQAVDAHRIQRDRCRGTLVWQLNDCWPVASWSSIDYEGRWKALQYRLKDAFANVAIAVHQNEDQSLDFYVVNDSLKEISGHWELWVVPLDGTQSKRLDAQNVRVASDGGKKMLRCKLSDLGTLRPKHVVLHAILKSGDKVLAEKITAFVKPGKLNLLKGDIKQEIKYFDDHLEITLTSPVAQYGVWLSDNNDKDIKWSDNYFFLLPNTPKTVFGYYDISADDKPDIRILSRSNLIEFDVFMLDSDDSMKIRS